MKNHPAHTCRLAGALLACTLLAALLATPASALRQGMDTEIIEVYWSPAESVARLIEPFLSPGGSVIPDPVTNVLIVTDTPANMAQIRALVRRFDVVQPQVRITARLVKASDSFMSNMGVRWGQGSPFGHNYSAVVIHDGMASVDASIQARQQSGHAQSDSELTVTTLALETAELALGSSLPVRGAHGSTDFRDVLVRLRVTPRILGQNRLRLEVEVRGDSGDDPMQGIDVSSTSTTVDVLSGQTVAIGSSNRVSDSSGGSGTVGTDIPLLGYAFGTRGTGGGQRSLVIFISAEIL